MSSNGLKISESVLDLTIKDDPELAPYIEKIKAIDSNRDGELSLAEVAKVVKELSESNKIISYMRKIILAILFIFVLLAVVMVVLIVLMREMYVNATSEGGLLVEKRTGRPLTIGSPSVGINYNDSQMNSLSQIFNNTPLTTLENTFRRKLMALPGKASGCKKPVVRALATDTISSVIEKCQYISKPGTDSKITLRISRGLDGKPTVQGIGDVETCGTFHDQIHVTEDQCIYLLQPVSCPLAGANHTVAVLWADSLLHQDHIASYTITCKGVCTIDQNIQWNLCGVSLQECPKASSANSTIVSPADMAAAGGSVGAGRRLLTNDADEDGTGGAYGQVATLGDAIGVGFKMNCESGSCFSVM